MGAITGFPWSAVGGGGRAPPGRQPRGGEVKPCPPCAHARHPGRWVWGAGTATRWGGAGPDAPCRRPAQLGRGTLTLVLGSGGCTRRGEPGAQRGATAPDHCYKRGWGGDFLQAPGPVPSTVPSIPLWGPLIRGSRSWEDLSPRSRSR